MNGPDVITGRTSRSVTRARSLLAPVNPVPGDAFAGTWSEPRWQAELAGILASPRPRAGAAAEPARPPRRNQPQPRRRRRRLGLSAIGATAAVTAIVVFAVGGPPPAATPSRGPEPSVFRWPSAMPGAQPGDAGPARSVLLAVASTVAHQPAPKVGAYWRSTDEYGDFTPMGPALGPRYMIVERGRETEWDPRGNSASSLVVEQWLGVQLASRADAAAWRRDGSPTTWPTLPDVGSADPEGYTSANGGSTHAAPGKPTVEFGGSGPSPLSYDGKALNTLSADPALLRGLLSQDYRLAHEGGGLGAWMFENAPDLLADPVTPAVRSAVYRILADLPGAVNLGTVRDVSGQSGTGIALATRYPRCLVGAGPQDPANAPTAPCTVQQRLIINPATGLPLAYELRYVSPPGTAHWPVAGGLFSYEIYQGGGWTNQAPPAR